MSRLGHEGEEDYPVESRGMILARAAMVEELAEARIRIKSKHSLEDKGEGTSPRLGREDCEGSVRR